MHDSTLYLQILWTGLANSSYQVLFAVAFALVLKVLGVWNFSQAGLMAVSFYSMYAVIDWLGWSVWAGLALGLLCCLAFAHLMESFAFATLRARGSGPIGFFILCFVVSQFAIYVLTLFFTAEPRFLLGNMMWQLQVVFGVYVTAWDVSAIGLALVMLTVLYLFLSYTKAGQFMIAVADNPELAETYGINKGRYYLLTMMIAAILVHGGMLLFGSKTAFYPELSLHMMLFAIAATIIGGIGNVFSAAIAAVVIVIIQQMSVLVIGSRWQPFLVFVILFATIIFFPRGVGSVRWMDGIRSINAYTYRAVRHFGSKFQSYSRL